MLDLVSGPLIAWNSDESAASLANRAMGTPPLQRRGGRLWPPDLAYGTVSWAVNTVAALGDGFYGTPDEILDLQSLVNYSAIARSAGGRTALREKARSGVGRAKEAGWAPWLLSTVGPALGCPVCRLEAWREIGMPAECWPTRAPLVQGCWRHEVLLVPQNGFADPTVRAQPPRNASRDILTFAANTVRLCRLAKSVGDAAACLRNLMAAAGFLRDDGRFYATRYREAYAAYGGRHAHDPALRKATEAPLAARAILDWVRGGGNDAIHPVYLVVALGMLDEAAASPASFAIRPRAGQGNRRGAWSARAVQPIRVLDGRSRYKRADIRDLAAQGCEAAEIASLCRLSLDIVYRTTRAEKLRPLIQEARHERLRAAARQAWLDVRAQHPASSSNVLRGLEPRAFKWLWKHDRAWLQSQRADFVRATGWRRAILPTAGSRQRVLARLTRAAASQQAAGIRCTRAGLSRALNITPYVLMRWAEASAEIADRLALLIQPSSVQRGLKGGLA